VEGGMTFSRKKQEQDINYLKNQEYAKFMVVLLKMVDKKLYEITLDKKDELLLSLNIIKEIQKLSVIIENLDKEDL
jgi:hypothetical protein